MSFIHNLIQKIPEGLEHARDEVIGRLNPNRRHDDPEEKKADEIRAEINASHRFNSFAEERTNNAVKWHVDGHDYMWALSEMLESAKECIFILDWWLTPELYLRRPPALQEQWRLDRVLKRRAEAGVKVYVVVYKEVTQTMSMSSRHTKWALTDLHPNVQCVRHPDHIGSKDSVEFWSHHEKVVVVDNHFACIGGLDLCFGRWDTHNHPLADVHPTSFSHTLFPGQDFNNARIMDFQNVGDYASNQLSLLESARMPWHDVHMTLTGPCVLDIVQHFTERWNEIKKRKYRESKNVDWLALPHNVQASPNEAVVRHPHRETWHGMGRRYRQRWHRFAGYGEDDGDDYDDQENHYSQPDPATCRVQVVRSVSDWSHGVLTEHSIQNAYIQLINEANHYIYIENQFFISSTVDGDQVTNKIAQALAMRIIQAAKEGRKFQVVIAIPEVPGFSGNIKDETSLKIIMAGQYRAMNRGGNSIYEVIRKEGIEPMDYIRFYHLRAYDRINSPSSFIQQVEARSGVSFLAAQVALARLWLGDQAFKTDDPSSKGQGQMEVKQVLINTNVETTEGLGQTERTRDNNKDDKDGKKKGPEPVPVPQTEDEARDTIRRFERAAREVRGLDLDGDGREGRVSDNVVQHMLQDKTELKQEQWDGSDEEELNSYVSELLYIHSKVMIVDDRRVIMGSANINDRSQKGDGDSEIALVVEDTDMIKSKMNGEDYMAARFAATLRRKLYKEHLGLIPPQDAYSSSRHPTACMHPAPTPQEDTTASEEDQLVADPLSEKTMDLWRDTARKNREVFTEIFRPVPTNLVRDWKAYENYVPKVKTGHVVPGIPLERVKSRLAEVKGALVECPIDFLIDEKDFVNGPEWKGLNPTLPIYI
ncbi:phospholipase D/nuclease [Dendrothele bispora CBS 962.96]|uniref:Phospholipase n=1 Tax=Dendrothele bispora (strain CBS 962.96) TaxID=1314807 RepID=A0A4S8M3Q7_DENBC|nr:phospholipase D/nuclease [Dendrothele bispora CBS 962.96]